MALREQEILQLKIKATQISPPKYIEVASQGIHKEGRYIGIEAFNVLGEPGSFIWYTNFNRRLNPELRTRDVLKFASYVVRMKIQLGIDIAVGPAISVRESYKGLVRVMDYSKSVGIYVEQSQRFGEALQARYGLKTMLELTREHPEAEDLFRRTIILSPLEGSRKEQKLRQPVSQEEFSPKELEEIRAFSRFSLQRFIEGLPRSSVDVDLDRVNAPFSVIRGLMRLYNSSSQKPVRNPDDLLKDLSYQGLRNMAVLTMVRFNQDPEAKNLEDLMKK